MNHDFNERLDELESGDEDELDEVEQWRAFLEEHTDTGDEGGAE